jgi:hypothetical protein
MRASSDPQFFSFLFFADVAIESMHLCYLGTLYFYNTTSESQGFLYVYLTSSPYDVKTEPHGMWRLLKGVNHETLHRI